MWQRANKKTFPRHFSANRKPIIYVETGVGELGIFTGQTEVTIRSGLLARGQLQGFCTKAS